MLFEINGEREFFTIDVKSFSYEIWRWIKKSCKTKNYALIIF